ncbi:TlpA family protein disulfide reductase [Pedobacter duraquae]|uniref:Thiol-disulfide isomerase/thioredoxin n=1 Tax=Pedobacter duraquae TaxID=425511 RepID=A0A4R6IFV4_9SPHI|nr:TlpA disulfide reductase family protein [Pedobacter duraquae]TDO20686.1 thiol-disulfide isomerase/thioredoxin [Pedobacter duraquae]
MKISFQIMIVLCAGTVQVKSQTADVFKKTMTNIDNFRSIQFQTNSVNENPFSPGSITTTKTTTSIIFNDDRSVSYQKEQSELNPGKILTRKIYENGKLYHFDIADSTYSIETPESPITSDLSVISQLLNESINKYPNKIINKADTLFQGKACYNFLIKRYDTLDNGHHDYTHKSILIDKQTFLPVYLREDGAGTMTKGGISVGRINFFAEQTFSNFQINKAILKTAVRLNGFSEPNKEMLKKGAVAPQLQLKTLSESAFASTNLKNKTLLVVFGSTLCPANPLANPMLNRLNEKFSDQQFAIVNIYSNEAAKEVKDYVSNNKLQFPVYLASRKLNKEFKTVGTPNFYLIGKDGTIIESIEGYSVNLENRLTTEISNSISKN